MCIVAAAVWKNTFLENTMESTIENIIKNWFKYARDRDKREKRKENAS